MSWPYPGDGPLARARRVARAYRGLLDEVSPEGCARLDAMIISWGEGWVASRLATYGPDDELTPAEAADAAAMSVASIRRARLAGRLLGVKTPAGWRYQARDVWQMAAQRGTRAARSPLADGDHSR